MTHNEPAPVLPKLFESDETAWLEQMAGLAATGEASQLDLPHLSEYLLDMAKRDKREVLRRLFVLLVHLLKWEHQPSKRSRSWELTIQEQREELRDLLESGVLRAYGEQELDRAYDRALRRAVVETNLAPDAFPSECPYTLDQIIGG